MRVTCAWCKKPMGEKCGKCGRFDTIGAPVTLSIPEGVLPIYFNLADAPDSWTNPNQIGFVPAIVYACPHDSHTWMNGQDGDSHGMCADCKAKEMDKAGIPEKTQLN